MVQDVELEDDRGLSFEGCMYPNRIYGNSIFTYMNA